MYRRRSRRSEERRRALLSAFFKILVVVAAFGATAYYAYETGAKVMHSELGSLQEKLAAANAQIKGLEEQADADHIALAGARKEADDLKVLYDQVKPSDDMRELIAALRARLGAGVEPKRLVFLIKSAENRHDCEPPTIKRFAVRTPRYRGPEGSTVVRIGDAVTLSLEGTGGNGGREQWFDPDKPVRLKISAAGMKDREVTNRLPLEEAIVVRGEEIHFTISTSSSRGFVEVVSEKCGA